MVLDNGLDLTMQTSTLPRQTPALKNDVWVDILFARFRPAIGSTPSNASRGNVITCRSGGHRGQVRKSRAVKKKPILPDNTMSN
jgi:hypothetical protein